VVSAASFPDASSRQGSFRFETVVTTADGHAFAVDVVARGLLAPTQLASSRTGFLGPTSTT
jgi:hypothetical protein